MKSFKEQYTLDERLAESREIIAKYPTRIPVIAEKYCKTDLPGKAVKPAASDVLGSGRVTMRKTVAKPNSTFVYLLPFNAGEKRRRLAGKPLSNSNRYINQFFPIFPWILLVTDSQVLYINPLKSLGFLQFNSHPFH
jgi:hypothetical protein